MAKDNFIFPKELISLKQWVNAREGHKLPMKSYEFKAAGVDAPADWSDYETALSALKSGKYDYLGFVFNNNGIVGIDIDEGYDEDGFLSSLSVDCMRACESYTEKSKSGRGIHILIKGDIPFDGRNNRKGIEMYKTGRYFIMTGKRLVYHELKENQAGLDYIVDKYFTDFLPENVSGSTAIYRPVWKEPEDGKISLSPSYPPIGEGGRNISLTSLAGALKREGYSKEYIYNELTKVNKSSCNPPLDDDEVRSIVRSVMRYRQREAKANGSYGR